MHAIRQSRFCAGLIALPVLPGQAAWQGSFPAGDFLREAPEGTNGFRALSSVIFLLTALLVVLALRQIRRERRIEPGKKPRT
jgi:hypothetical protein